MSLLRAGAAEYFVATPGNDAADGLSEPTAFATIAQGVSRLCSGDILTILPGRYFEAVSANLSGAPNTPILIRAKYPGTVLMHGDMDVSGFLKVDGTLATYALELTVRVEGVAERSTHNVYDPVSTVEDVDFTLGSYYQDPATKRLYVHTSDSRAPDKHALAVAITNASGLYLDAGGDRRISDLIIDGLAFTGYSAAEKPAEGFSRWGIHIMRPQRVVIRRCLAYLNMGGIYLGQPCDCLVEQCRAFGNYGRYGAHLGVNFYATGPMTNMIFKHNISEDQQIAFYNTHIADCHQISNIVFSRRQLLPGRRTAPVLFIKGRPLDGITQYGNCVIGAGWLRSGVNYSARSNLVEQIQSDSPEQDASNIILSQYAGLDRDRNFADPIAMDFRLQSDSMLRGTGSKGCDPGPYPYRAEVFFVAPEGDDRRDGTSLAQAWRTIAHAAQKAEAGQTVYITSGVYHESLIPARSGQPGKPIRFARRGYGRVILDGGGALPVGIRLVGKSLIEIQGLLIRNYARHGIQAQGARDITVQECMVQASGTDGIAAVDAPNFAIRHALIADSAAAGISLSNSPGAILRGTIFDGNACAIIGDAISIAGMWADENNYAPAPFAPIARVAARTLNTLQEWQDACGQDYHSLTAVPGYLPGSEACELRLDSPLIGKGPHAAIIGPYILHQIQTPLAIENPRIQALSSTTATLEWATPNEIAAFGFWDRQYNGGTRVDWGETPDCSNTIYTTAGLFHTMSLTGLKPGAQYYYRLTAGQTLGYRAGMHAPESHGLRVTPAARSGSFKTLPSDSAGLIRHVAPDGSDEHDGLTPATAWRTLNHAAAMARPGDSVLVHGGIYHEFVRVRCTGDGQAPIVFRAASGEKVWLDGDNLRVTALQLENKSHLIFDGFYFRNFRWIPHAGNVVNIKGGKAITIRRCFYDGRATSSWMASFLRANNTSNLTVENCVMINGVGQGLNLGAKCRDVTVRHCVFYNVLISPLEIYNPDGETITVTHNIFAGPMPEKTAVRVVLVNNITGYRADHNGYFTRIGPEEKVVLQTKLHDNKVRYRLRELQDIYGLEQGSFFGNPGFKVIDTLLPPTAKRGEWQVRELHWDPLKQEYRPLEFTDFFADPSTPYGRSAAGAPVGLDPQAFIP